MPRLPTIVLPGGRGPRPGPGGGPVLRTPFFSGSIVWTPYVSAVLADNPLAYWRLGDIGSTAVDLVAGHHGTFSGTVTKSVAGATLDADTAVTFSANGYARAVAPFTLSADFTLETWVKKNGVSGNPIAIHIGNPSNWAGTNTMLLYVGDSSSGATAVRLFLNGPTVTKGVNTQTTDNLWHHIVVTRSGANIITMYLDGLQLGTTGVLTGTITGTEVNLGAGDNAGTAAQFLTGSLDEVAIYPTALTLTRIQAHYTAATLYSGPFQKDALQQRPGGFHPGKGPTRARFFFNRDWVNLTPRTATPPTATLVLTTFAPVVSTPRVVTPGKLSLTLATFAPAITVGKVVTPTTRALVLSRFAPTVSTPQLVTPLTKALALNRFAPIITVPQATTLRWRQVTREGTFVWPEDSFEATRRDQAVTRVEGEGP